MRIVIRTRSEDKYREGIMAARGVAGDPRGHLGRLFSLLGRELWAVVPPTLFFFVGFNLILFTKRLFLGEYLIQYAGFFIATTGALIVGKSVLVADKMPFSRYFDNAPLAYPILFKTLIYALFVSAARLIEALVHYLVEGKVLGGGRFFEHLIGNFSWDHFVAVQLWIVVLFLIYVTASELNQMFGDGELFKIFFTRRSSDLKSTRRARIRLLIRVGRLTAAHPVETLADPLSMPHADLVGVLRDLARESRIG
jgi:hypothetical protein